MKNLKSKVAKFLRDEEGLELSEYAVAGGIIVIATVAAFTALSGKITEGINAIAAAIRTTV